MFSLQRALGEDRRILDLLESCAVAACQSVSAMKKLLSQQGPPSLTDFRKVRKVEKELLGNVEELLLRSLVLALEREDVQALANSLYRIPKTVDNFAHRYIIAAPQLSGVDFSRQIALMERGCSTVTQMICGLRDMMSVAELKQLNANMQKIENNADDVMLELISGLFEPGVPALRALIIKDLIELNEKVVDRCRDAGNVIIQVALKNA
jgi:uncharacterized protein